jgi:hypothetical protein
MRDLLEVLHQVQGQLLEMDPPSSNDENMICVLATISARRDEHQDTIRVVYLSRGR